MLRWFAALTLRLAGWRTVFTQPPGPKTVIVVYPHTSNWDFPIGVSFNAVLPIFINWAGKDTLFRWPLKGLFIKLGGIPINRRERTGLVDQLKGGAKAADMPWEGADGLEWTLPSPAPYHTFETPPIVK